MTTLRKFQVIVPIADDLLAAVGGVDGFIEKGMVHAPSDDS